MKCFRMDLIIQLVYYSRIDRCYYSLPYTNKDPEKSFKGSFNVRIPTELHRRVYRKSLREGISLNQLVQRALEKEITNLKKPHVV